MKHRLLPIPESFTLHAIAILNRAHSRTAAPVAPSQEETLVRMRRKGLYLRMDESPAGAFTKSLHYQQK